MHGVGQRPVNSGSIGLLSPLGRRSSTEPDRELSGRSGAARVNGAARDRLPGAIPDCQPEPWESGAASPFLWIDTAQGNVEMWALGEDRFRITAPGHEQLVTGYDEAERAADALAEQFK